MQRKDLYPTRGDEEAVLPRRDPVIHGRAKGKYALNDDEAAYYEANGFIVFPDFFSPEEVAEFNMALQKLETNDALKQKEEYITEPGSTELRTIFSQHLFSPVFDALSKDRRILDKIEHVLGSKAYIHHSRINIKPAFKGKSFPWHSDFETWHAEDGIANCRMLSAWVMLTENTYFNGPLYLVPQSHRYFVSCPGKTPKAHYKESLRHQRYGVPSDTALEALCENTELVAALGRAGTLVLHDGNVMHGSPDNISHTSRSNAFFVYNSVENLPRKPFAAEEPRAPFLSLRDYTPL